MRRLALLFTATVLVIFAAVPAMAASGSDHKDAGEESQAVAEAADWFTSQRFAPNGAVDPNAYAAAAAQVAALPSVGGAWTERTNLPGADGNDFSDSPQYIDPTSQFSNSGAGDRWVAGRMTALAAAPDGTLFAGAADGGVWKSTDGGQHWTPTTDTQATLSIGALLVTGSGQGYTVYAGTGEANTSSDSYAGVGVLASTDGGASWHRVGGPELNGALIFRLAQDGSTLFAATSHGLYSFDTASSTNWTRGAAARRPAERRQELQPRRRQHDHRRRGPARHERQPGGGCRRLARRRADQRPVRLERRRRALQLPRQPAGWVPAKAEGRTTLAYSAAGDRAYAIVQSPYLLNVGTNGHTLLQGVYESNNGDPNGPWTKIADANKLASSGSAQFIPRIGKGYQPGHPGLVQPVPRRRPDQQGPRLRRPRGGLRDAERRLRLEHHRARTGTSGSSASRTPRSRAPATTTRRTRTSTPPSSPAASSTSATTAASTPVR